MHYRFLFFLIGFWCGFIRVNNQSRKNAQAQSMPWQVKSKPYEKRNNRASYRTSRVNPFSVFHLSSPCRFKVTAGKSQRI